MSSNNTTTYNSPLYIATPQPHDSSHLNINDHLATSATPYTVPPDHSDLASAPAPFHADYNLPPSDTALSAPSPVLWNSGLTSWSWGNDPYALPSATPGFHFGFGFGRDLADSGNQDVASTLYTHNNNASNAQQTAFDVGMRSFESFAAEHQRRWNQNSEPHCAPTPTIATSQVSSYIHSHYPYTSVPSSNTTTPQTLPLSYHPGGPWKSTYSLQEVLPDRETAMTQSSRRFVSSNVAFAPSLATTASSTRPPTSNPVGNTIDNDSSRGPLPANLRSDFRKCVDPVASNCRSMEGTISSTSITSNSSSLPLSQSTPPPFCLTVSTPRNGVPRTLPVQIPSLSVQPPPPTPSALPSYLTTGTLNSKSFRPSLAFLTTPSDHPVRPLPSPPRITGWIPPEQRPNPLPLAHMDQRPRMLPAAGGDIPTYDAPQGQALMEWQVERRPGVYASSGCGSESDSTPVLGIARRVSCPSGLSSLIDYGNGMIQTRSSTEISPYTRIVSQPSLHQSDSTAHVTSPIQFCQIASPQNLPASPAFNTTTTATFHNLFPQLPLPPPSSSSRPTSNTLSQQLSSPPSPLSGSIWKRESSQGNDNPLRRSARQSVARVEGGIGSGLGKRPASSNGLGESNSVKMVKVDTNKAESTASSPSKQNHQCLKCDERFTRRNDLERHIRCKHTDVKPYACPACHKRWGRKDKLNDHIEKEPSCKQLAPPRETRVRPRAVKMTKERMATFVACFPN
ncbi:hypothetical protein CI109_104883 [Kwoniella shandongensis]|uniref:Uncharacterized protein n=1 Tax=Kwoniella shandongensis TaxID=1734106 RepID=A0A5M6BSD3_9TREE|nr:uncharacterized protein CI109_006602 [Kwoniella shandongensis]KAA5525051.1 hypothetical protein CI109_006602 [Kwoniella shandongensis]